MVEFKIFVEGRCLTVDPETGDVPAAGWRRTRWVSLRDGALREQPRERVARGLRALLAGRPGCVRVGDPLPRRSAEHRSSTHQHQPHRHQHHQHAAHCTRYKRYSEGPSVIVLQRDASVQTDTQTREHIASPTKQRKHGISTDSDQSSDEDVSTKRKKIFKPLSQNKQTRTVSSSDTDKRVPLREKVKNNMTKVFKKPDGSPNKNFAMPQISCADGKPDESVPTHLFLKRNNQGWFIKSATSPISNDKDLGHESSKGENAPIVPTTGKSTHIISDSESHDYQNKNKHIIQKKGKNLQKKTHLKKKPAHVSSDLESLNECEQFLLKKVNNHQEKSPKKQKSAHVSLDTESDNENEHFVQKKVNNQQKKSPKNQKSTHVSLDTESNNENEQFLQKKVKNKRKKSPKKQKSAHVSLDSKSQNESEKLLQKKANNKQKKSPKKQKSAHGSSTSDSESSSSEPTISERKEFLKTRVLQELNSESDTKNFEKKTIPTRHRLKNSNIPRYLRKRTSSKHEIINISTDAGTDSESDTSEVGNKKVQASESEMSHAIFEAKRSQTADYDECCMELIINEEDVALLRTFIERKCPSIDLYKFDCDDEYKQEIFYRINPVVRLERCKRIAGELSERARRQFAEQLGLRSVTSASSDERQPPRRSRRSRQPGKDTSNVKTQRDKDTSKAKTQRDKDTSNAKTQRDKDTSNAKTQRDKDTSKAKTQQDKDTSNAKTQRDKDTSKAKTQRDKDTKNEKTQRDKDTRNEKTQRDKDTSNEKTQRDKDTRNEKTQRDKDTRNEKTQRDKDTRNEKTQLDKGTRNEKTQRHKDTSNKETQRDKDTRNEKTQRDKDTSNKETQRDKDTRNEKTQRHKDTSNKETQRDKDTSDKETQRDKDRREKRQTVQKMSEENDKDHGEVEVDRKRRLKPRAVLVPKRSSVPAGREFTSLEDHTIVAWVSADARRERAVNGNWIWQKLEDNYAALAGQRRTWHSLRNRYLRYILPSLGSLSLPMQQVSRLRAAAATGKIKSRIKSNREASILRAPPSLPSASSRRLRPAPPHPPPHLAEESPPPPAGAAPLPPPPPARPAHSPRYSDVTRRFAHAHSHTSTPEKPAPTASSSGTPPPSARRTRRLYNPGAL